MNPLNVIIKRWSYPNFGETLKHKGLSLEKLGNVEEAQKLFNKAKQLA
jgi:hypothetical protein